MAVTGRFWPRYDRHLHQVQKIGAWILVMTSTINGIDFGAQDRRDALFLQYGIEPLDLYQNCNGFGISYSISHTLEFKKGGFVMSCHNKLRDGVTDLAGNDLTPTHVYDDHLIHSGRNMKSGRSQLDGTTQPNNPTAAMVDLEQKVNLLIWDLREKGMY